MSPLRGRLLNTLKLGVAYTVTAIVAAFVTVRLTARGSTVTVPVLTGIEVKQAQGMLQDKGLTFVITGEEWHERYPVDSVISQQPAANARVKRGRRVKLTLSRGSEIIQMPRLSELNLNEAELLLRQLGLETGGVTYVPSPKAKRTVLAHDPDAGVKVARSHPVMLLVSNGRAPAVLAIPRVTGLPTRVALARLRKAGLKISGVAYETTAQFAEGTVIAQEPPGGFRAIRGDKVRLRAARSTSTGQARWVKFTFKVTEGPARRVRALIVDEGGSREIANDIEEGGSTLRFSTQVQGEAVAQFFIGGALVEEKKL